MAIPLGMAAGFDIVLLFIGLEVMAISTYVLVGFLRPLDDPRGMAALAETGATALAMELALTGDPIDARTASTE